MAHDCWRRLYLGLAALSTSERSNRVRRPILTARSFPEFIQAWTVERETWNFSATSLRVRYFFSSGIKRSNEPVKARVTASETICFKSSRETGIMIDCSITQIF